jgi:microcystin-dependent protein
MSGNDDARGFLESIAGYTKPGDPQQQEEWRPVKLGTVDALYTGGGRPRVLFDGESLMGVREYPWVGSQPRAGQRVVLQPVGHGYVILGPLDQFPGANMPVGTSIEGHWAAAPVGFTLEDGGLLLRADYPALFAVLGTRYNTGGELATQFRKPDSRGKTTVGIDASYSGFDTLGKTGGARVHYHDLSSVAWAKLRMNNATSAAIAGARVAADPYTLDFTYTAATAPATTTSSSSLGTPLGGRTNQTAATEAMSPFIIINRAIRY